MPSDSDAQRTTRARLLLEDLGNAVARLRDALSQTENEFIRDAAIQRFEFSFELAWKAVQAVARLEGQPCHSPRAAVSTAWQNGWVTDEAAWLDMLDARNKTSHTYRAAVAREVFDSLSGHLPHLGDLREALLARLAAIEGSSVWSRND